MRAEFARILPAVRAGGYIPAVDHQTPPDVTVENYRIFVRLLREVSYAPYEPCGSSGVPARAGAAAGRQKNGSHSPHL